MRISAIVMLSTVLFSAHLAMAGAVPVRACNETAMAVSIHLTSYVDENGQTRDADLTWKFPPHQSEGGLLVDGVPLVASAVDVTYTTVDGDSAWKYRAAISAEQIVLKITYAELARGDAPVSLVNETSQPIRCMLIGFIDVHGEETTLKSTTIDLAPNQSTALNFNGSPMVASALRFFLETPEGAHAWRSEYNGGGNMAMTFTDDFLARHRTAVSDAKRAAIAKLLGAFAADKIANSALEKPEMELSDVLVAGAGKFARSQLIDSAVDDVFPTFGDGEKHVACTVIGLVFDGELNVQNVAIAEVRDAIIKKISEENVDAGRAAELGSFIADLVAQREKVVVQE